MVNVKSLFLLAACAGTAAAAPRRLLQDAQQPSALAAIAAGNPVPDPPGGTGFVQPTAAYQPVGSGPAESAAPGGTAAATTGPRRAAAVAANVLASALLAPAPAPSNADGSTAPAAGRVVKLPAFGAVPSLGLPALPALQFAVDREQLAAARGALGIKAPPARAPRHEKAPRDVAPRSPHGHGAPKAEAGPTQP